MKDKKKGCSCKIIVGGSGGQGVVTFGKVLAFAGAEKRFNVCLLPAYGAEMRGGYVFSMISFSTKDLVSPVISRADFGIFMNEASLQMLKQHLKDDAWILWNSSLMAPKKELKNKNIGIPASEIAEKLGDIRVANMIMLGSILRILKDSEFCISEKDIEAGIKETLGKNSHLNYKAVIEGIRIVEQAIQNGRAEI